PFAPRAFTRLNTTTRSSDFSADFTQMWLSSFHGSLLPRIGADLLPTAHAVAFNSWLPSEGPTADFHRLAHHHVQRTSGRASPSLRWGWTRNKQRHKLNHVPGLTHGL